MNWRVQVACAYSKIMRGLADAFLECLHSVYLALQTPDFTEGATHYHLETITPEWASGFTYVAQFGSHKFYKQ